MKDPDTNVAGVDVGKASLDASIAKARPRRFDNTTEGIARMLAWLQDSGATLVVCEASGGYERQMANFLRSSNMPVHVAHALRVRSFARAAGYEAKTDDLDARILSEYGETFDLSSDPPGAGCALRCTWPRCPRYAATMI